MTDSVDKLVRRAALALQQAVNSTKHNLTTTRSDQIEHLLHIVSDYLYSHGQPYWADLDDLANKESTGEMLFLVKVNRDGSLTVKTDYQLTGMYTADSEVLFKQLQADAKEGYEEVLKHIPELIKTIKEHA